MPEERERREVIVTNGNGRNSMAVILGALIVGAAVIFAVWFFATQMGGEEGDSPGITIEIDPGGNGENGDENGDENDGEGQ